MPRDLPIPGRQLDGIHFAMEFLTKNQKRLLMTMTIYLESGGRGITSKLTTLLHLWRTDVPIQSVPVSPPPITITSLPVE